MTLTVKEVIRRVEEIRAIAVDDEVAHGREDDLHQDVLRAIAAGASNPVGLASCALETTHIEFSRWCA